MENLAHETSACKIRKFEMMKYTFEVDEEYVAIKELINHSETNVDARCAYRELFYKMDDGWLVTRATEFTYDRKYRLHERLLNFMHDLAETNLTYCNSGVTCEDEAKRRNSKAKKKIFEENRLEDKQPEEKTNTDCLVKEQEKEYHTGWKIKMGNVLDSYNQSSTQQCMRSVVTKYLGIAGISSRMVLMRQHGTGSIQVLHGFEVEVEPLGDHTFDVEPQENVNQGAEEEHGVYLKLELELLRNEKLYAKFTKGEAEKNWEMMVSTLWIKLYSECEYEIRYHPGKANVVTGALNRKERVKPRRVRAMAMTIQYGKEDESLYFMDRVEVPLVGSEMDEAHASRQTLQKVFEMRMDLSTLVQETTDKVLLIKEKFKAGRDRQKSYDDNSRKPLEFEVGNRPFEILERIGPAAYRLRLPEELSGIEVDKTLRFVEEPVENSDREVKRLKCSIMVVVKVHLGSKRGKVVSSKISCEKLNLLVKSRDKISLRRGYCDNYDLSRYVRLDNQSIERGHLNGIGFMLDFVEFISFTFSDKEMILVIEAVSR
ncbi:hypothetical protein Tco_1066521 [Tanacetum coccineum]|uniref:Reverse transcriptase domain-containing protein n=1 Tax=Tanacetum coccineum TaxID=301880 RepID=A0ABQ5HAC4_9ASTR